MDTGARIVRFGAFEADLQTAELHRHGLRIRLQEKPFQVLALLLERRGELVTREELREKLWPADTFVDFDHSVNTAINKLREALQDSADNPRFIETLPRRGYRFIAPVETVEPTAELTITAEPVSKLVPPGPRIRLGWWVVPALAVLVTAGYGAWQRLGPRAQPPARVMLAVLPLENLGGNPEQEYFSDGLTEEMITQLSRLQPERLGVIARTSTMHYKGSKKSVGEIGRELKVDYILEGSVRREGERVRISAQLVRVSDQTHLWADSYQRDVRDILSLQDEVAQAIASEIQLKLTPQEQTRLARSRPVHPEAYEEYLKGRYAWNSRKLARMQQALEYFQRAIAHDPDYAPSYAGLADTFTLLGAAGYDVLPPVEAAEKAKAAVLKALEIDDSLAEAHVSLAFLHFSYDWDWAAAEKEFKRAIALNPGYATAHQWYSEYLVAMGRFAEARKEAEAALVLDPLSPILHQNLARPAYYAKQFDESLKQSQKALELDPEFPVSQLRLGRAYAAKGMYPEAIEAFERFATLGGNTTLALASLGNAYARAGDRRRAVECLAKLQALAEKQPVSSYQFAILHTGLGEKDQAIAALEKAYQERTDFMAYLKVESLFDPLRSDPRFQDLLRRMNFPE